MIMADVTLLMSSLVSNERMTGAKINTINQWTRLDKVG